MIREEQKEIRELKKQIPVILRKQKKAFRFQYAYDFLYRFEGDFLYIVILNLSANKTGVLNITILVKPWILNDLYWEIQQMNMDEMRGQPKSFHVRGAFTINNIFYSKNKLSFEKY